MGTFELFKWIKHCEKYYDRPFVDESGVLKIGYGRHLDEHGISKDEGDLLFQNDYIRTLLFLSTFDWFACSPINVQASLINMTFTLKKDILTFKKMIAAILSGSYAVAALEITNSLWAQKNKRRANDVALMMRGQDGTEERAD